MLTMLPGQMALLAASGEVHTEARALQHLRFCIPGQCAILTEAQLVEIVRWGRRRSRGYGLQREVDFFRYLNLMFMFGVEFDTDARYPWAARALQSKARAAARMDLLMDHAMRACSALEKSKES